MAQAVPGLAQTPKVAVGGEQQVNAYTTSYQEKPAIALGPERVVVWQSNGSGGSDSSGRSIQGRRTTSDGTPIGRPWRAAPVGRRGQVQEALQGGEVHRVGRRLEEKTGGDDRGTHGCSLEAKRPRVEQGSRTRTRPGVGAARARAPST